MDRVGSIADTDIDAMFGTNVFGLISLTQLLVRREFLSTDCILNVNIDLYDFRLQGTQGRTRYQLGIYRWY